MKRPFSLSYQYTTWRGSRPAMKAAERSLAEIDTTRAPGRAATSRSPKVGTRRLPGPAMVPLGANSSEGRPWRRLNRRMASSLSKTTVSPAGPAPTRVVALPISPEACQRSSSAFWAKTSSRPSFSTSL